MSAEPFNKLVKLAARAFYDDITTKGDNQPKTARGDNRGMAVVALDALTRQDLMELVNRSGKFSKKFEGFTGTADSLGKSLNNSKTRAEIG